MSNRELWKNFLENIKEVISSTSFDIWFNENDTKLYSFKNDDLKRDYYLRDLANGRFDSYRETKADGKVEWTTKYWE